MSGSGTGRYGVNLDVLHEVTTGLRSIMDQLVDLGMDGDETNGSSIENLAFDDEQTSSEQITNTWASLLEHAHYAVREHLEAGKAIIDQLEETRTTYQMQEEAARAEFTWDPMDGQRLENPTAVMYQQIKGDA